MIFTHFICLILIAVDQLLKYVILHYNNDLIIKSIKIPNLLYITPAWNSGVSFGILSEFAHISNVVLVINTLVIGYFYQYCIKNMRKEFCIPYAIILAGGISNCIDRIVHNAVFDFLNLYINGKSVFIFNGSDAMITFGIMLLLFKKIIYK